MRLFWKVQQDVSRLLPPLKKQSELHFTEYEYFPIEEYIHFQGEHNHPRLRWEPC